MPMPRAHQVSGSAVPFESGPSALLTPPVRTAETRAYGKMRYRWPEATTSLRTMPPRRPGVAVHGKDGRDITNAVNARRGERFVRSDSSRQARAGPWALVALEL